MKKQIVLVAIVLAAGVAIISAQDAGKVIYGGVVNGKALSLPVPEVPAAAKAVGAAGAVNVQVVIDEEGNVETAQAVSGHPLLKSSSVAAARQAKFTPTKLAGKPVKVSGVIVYNFASAVEDEIVTPGDETEYIGISASIRLMERVNTDPKLSSVADGFFEEFGKEFQGEGLPAEFDSINELPKATSQRRTDILAELRILFKRDLSGDDFWQFDVGQVFGDLLAESLKHATHGESDANIFRVNLLQMKELMKSAPKTFPSDLQAKINEITVYGDTANLDDPDVLSLVIKKIDIIGDIILG